MSEITKVILWAILWALLILVIATAIGVGISTLVTKIQCNELTRLNFPEEYQFSFWNGCLMRVSGTWFPFNVVQIR